MKERGREREREGEERQTHIKLIKHTSIKNPQRHHRKRGPNSTHEVSKVVGAGAGAGAPTERGTR